MTSSIDSHPGLLNLVTSGAGRPLVLAHGFTQNSACWGRFGRYLARSRQILAVDLPGHGASPARQAGPWVVGDLLAATVTTAAHTRSGEPQADYLGYSMGGRMCLHLALAHPGNVRKLVLIATSPGIADPSERVLRAAQDEKLAQRLSDTADQPGAFESFLVSWLSMPLFKSLDHSDAAISSRLRNSPLDLAASLRMTGPGVQEPLFDRLADIAVPVLVMAGALDLRYCEIGKSMVRSIGRNAELAIVPGAGHACHLERPELTGRIVDSFLGPT